MKKQNETLFKLCRLTGKHEWQYDRYRFTDFRVCRCCLHLQAKKENKWVPITLANMPYGMKKKIYKLIS